MLVHAPLRAARGMLRRGAAAAPLIGASCSLWQHDTSRHSSGPGCLGVSLETSPFGPDPRPPAPAATAHAACKDESMLTIAVVLGLVLIADDVRRRR